MPFTSRPTYFPSIITASAAPRKVDIIFDMQCWSGLRCVPRPRKQGAAMGLNVAITGMGVVSALGFSAQELVDRLVADDLGIQETPWTASDPERFEFWAPVEGFTPPEWMQGNLSGIDPFAQHAGAAA